MSLKKHTHLEFQNATRPTFCKSAGKLQLFPSPNLLKVETQNESWRLKKPWGQFQEVKRLLVLHIHNKSTHTPKIKRFSIRVLLWSLTYPYLSHLLVFSPKSIHGNRLQTNSQGSHLLSNVHATSHQETHHLTLSLCICFFWLTVYVWIWIWMLGFQINFKPHLMVGWEVQGNEEMTIDAQGKWWNLCFIRCSILMIVFDQWWSLMMGTWPDSIMLFYLFF